MRTFPTITIHHWHLTSAMLIKHGISIKHGIFTPPHLPLMSGCPPHPLKSLHTPLPPSPTRPTLQQTDSKGRASQVLAVSSPSGKRPPSSGQGSAAPRPGLGPGQAAERPRSSQVVLLSSTKQVDQAQVQVGAQEGLWKQGESRRLGGEALYRLSAARVLGGKVQA